MSEHRRLIGIELALDKIKKRTGMKGVRGFLRTLTLSKDTAEALKKCNQDLEWEMKLFDVRHPQYRNCAFGS